MSKVAQLNNDSMAITNEVPVLERLYLVTQFWKAWALEEGREGMDMDAFGRELVHKMTSGATEYFLLKADGQFVGFLEATVNYDPAIPGMVVFGERAYIVPEYRGRGAFRKAFEVMETWAIEEKGCVHGVVEVAVGNDALINFYESFDFEVTHLKMRRVRTVQ